MTDEEADLRVAFKKEAKRIGVAYSFAHPDEYAAILTHVMAGYVGAKGDFRWRMDRADAYCAKAAGVGSFEKWCEARQTPA